LGGFYGYLFVFYLEVDLCWRAQLIGYKIACCTQSVIYHVGGGTLPKGHFRKTFYNFRNNLIMLSRNLVWQEKVWKIPLRLVLDGVFAVKSMLSGDFSSFKGVLFAHFAFYKWCLFYPKKYTLPKKPMHSLNGVCRRWLIWQHFAKNKKYFDDFFKN
jgi:GT2 family glycosyltransferase